MKTQSRKDLAPSDRDRALRRLNRMTAGFAAGGVLATAGLASLAAVTYHGSGSAGTATLDVDVAAAATAAPTATSDTDTTTAAAAATPTPTPVPTRAPTRSSRGGQVTSGGS